MLWQVVESKWNGFHIRKQNKPWTYSSVCQQTNRKYWPRSLHVQCVEKRRGPSIAEADSTAEGKWNLPDWDPSKVVPLSSVERHSFQRFQVASFNGAERRDTIESVLLCGRHSLLIVSKPINRAIASGLLLTLWWPLTLWRDHKSDSFNKFGKSRNVDGDIFARKSASHEYHRYEMKKSKRGNGNDRKAREKVQQWTILTTHYFE